MVLLLALITTSTSIIDVKNQDRLCATEEMVCARVYVCVCERERESRDTRYMTENTEGKVY